MMETNQAPVGQVPPIDRMGVIQQLVSQQFYLPPNFITDRTNRIELQVLGSDLVFRVFSDFLYNISSSAKGEDAASYFAILEKASKDLNLIKSDIEDKFHKKTKGFLNEGLATEEILFITLIASILESLDLIHYRIFLADLRALFNEATKEEKMDQITREETFKKGIERLGEIADSYFSILLNLRKVIELAHTFKIKIDYDRNEVKSYYEEVFTGIKTNY